MRSAIPEKPHERRDHRARCALERWKYRKHNADLFEYARWPQIIHSYTLRNKTQDVHNPDPLALPWGDRCPTGHGLRPGPLVTPAQHPRLPFHWKRTPASLGRNKESHEDFLDFRIYPKSVPRDLSQDFSNFSHTIPVGLHPWSRSYLVPAYARIAEASAGFPVPPEGPDSGRHVSPSAVSDPSRRARSVAPHPTPLKRGRFVCYPRAPSTPAQEGLSHATPSGGVT